MKYLLSLIGDESEWEDIAPDDMKAEMDRMDAFNREMAEAGVLVSGEGLQPSSNATTVRFGEGGKTVVTDGPFAETKEQLAGYWVIECASLDDALEWTKKVPIEGGVIEVRPMFGEGEPMSIAEYEKYAAQAQEDVLGQVQGDATQ